MRHRLSQDEERAIGRGLLVAPLAAGAAGFALSIWAIPMAVVIAILFTLTATVITVCVAYPLLLWFIPRGLTLTKTLMSGALLGNIPAAIAAVGTIARYGDVEVAGLVRPSVVGTAVGLLAAAAFWASSGGQLARRRDDGEL